eukprot:TRINITY_DN18128_c0_g1_i2.p1 TRINITY_DN18128_c0_g1~~TRINITY_DN18128_c0_g1_i2.p1  ORF type:complete len:158 (+),score=9.82 TRINITY_DN18128_c0_g1_i2:150-623(+)
MVCDASTRWCRQFRLVAVALILTIISPRAAAASSCSSCWARSRAAVVPGDANPDYVPGKSPGEGPHVCPDSLPFVVGATEGCGCMKQYHGKVCSEQKCCSATYHCYGNCGDNTILWVVLAVGGGLFILAVCCRVLYVGLRKRGQSSSEVVSMTQDRE